MLGMSFSLFARTSSLVLTFSLLGCSDSASPNSGAGGTTSNGGAQAKGGAVGSGGTSTAGGTTSNGGTTSSGGTSTSTGGAPANGGASSRGGAGGSSNGGSAALGGTQSAGGTSSMSGGAASGGATTGGTTGAGGSVTASGGSSTTMPKGSAAKYHCTAGATYGSPLTGMGSIAQVSAPSSDYFAFIEGPVWIAPLGTVFFSDNASSPSERIFKLVPPATSPMLFLGTSGTNGLAVDNDNKLVGADQRNKRITRLDPMTGQSSGTAISTGSAKPNDVLVRSDGNIYFTDPDSGFYRIPPGGTPGSAMRVTQGSRPNGLVLSLDENTLYVGDVGNRSISQWTIAADGSVSATSTPFVAQTKSDTVDGMCLDCAGNVYASTANGVEIYSPTGSYVGTVMTGESSNCTFGGADRKTMFVTSRAVLKHVTLGVPGLPN